MRVQVLKNWTRVLTTLRDTLTHENKAILKGERIFIRKSLRAEVKQQLSPAHLGYDSTLHRAYDTTFWLGMPGEIKQFANNRNVCQQTHIYNPPVTLLLYNEGLSPFEKVGVDIFEYVLNIT